MKGLLVKSMIAELYQVCDLKWECHFAIGPDKTDLQNGLLAFKVDILRGEVERAKRLIRAGQAIAESNGGC